MNTDAPWSNSWQTNECPPILRVHPGRDMVSPECDSAHQRLRRVESGWMFGNDTRVGAQTDPRPSQNKSRQELHHQTRRNRLAWWLLSIGSTTPASPVPYPSTVYNKRPSCRSGRSAATWQLSIIGNTLQANRVLTLEAADYPWTMGSGFRRERILPSDQKPELMLWRDADDRWQSRGWRE